MAAIPRSVFSAFIEDDSDNSDVNTNDLTCDYDGDIPSMDWRSSVSDSRMSIGSPEIVATPFSPVSQIPKTEPRKGHRGLSIITPGVSPTNSFGGISPATVRGDETWQSVKTGNSRKGYGRGRGSPMAKYSSSYSSRGGGRGRGRGRGRGGGRGRGEGRVRPQTMHASSSKRFSFEPDYSPSPNQNIRSVSSADVSNITEPHTFYGDRSASFSVPRPDSVSFGMKTPKPDRSQTSSSLSASGFSNRSKSSLVYRVKTNIRNTLKSLVVTYSDNPKMVAERIYNMYNNHVSEAKSEEEVVNVKNTIVNEVLMYHLHEFLDLVKGDGTKENMGDKHLRRDCKVKRNGFLPLSYLGYTRYPENGSWHRTQEDVSRCAKILFSMGHTQLHKITYEKKKHDETSGAGLSEDAFHSLMVASNKKNGGLYRYPRTHIEWTMKALFEIPDSIVRNICNEIKNKLTGKASKNHEFRVRLRWLILEKPKEFYESFAKTLLGGTVAGSLHKLTNQYFDVLLDAITAKVDLSNDPCFRYYFLENPWDRRNQLRIFSSQLSSSIEKVYHEAHKDDDDSPKCEEVRSCHLIAIGASYARIYSGNKEIIENAMGSSGNRIYTDNVEGLKKKIRDLLKDKEMSKCAYHSLCNSSISDKTLIRELHDAAASDNGEKFGASRTMLKFMVINHASKHCVEIPSLAPEATTVVSSTVPKSKTSVIDDSDIDYSINDICEEEVFPYIDRVKLNSLNRISETESTDIIEGREKRFVSSILDDIAYGLESEVKKIRRNKESIKDFIKSALAVAACNMIKDKHLECIKVVFEHVFPTSEYEVACNEIRDLKEALDIYMDECPRGVKLAKKLVTPN